MLCGNPDRAKFLLRPEKNNHKLVIMVNPSATNDLRQYSGFVVNPVRKKNWSTDDQRKNTKRFFILFPVQPSVNSCL